MKKITLKIKGMHCHSCEMLIGDALEDIGVKSNVDSKLGTAEIEFDENKVSIDKIKNVIKSEGDYSIE